MPSQYALFPDSQQPEGLRYQLNFVTKDEERELIARFAALPLAPFQFGAFEGKRRVASFGLRYDFSDQRLHAAEAIPLWVLPVARRIEAFASLPKDTIRHVLFTEYEAGVGIGWHRDKVAFDLVFGLSLASAGKLRFRKKHEGGWQRFTLDAEPRSLYLMTGEARSAWEHSIPAVEALRYSITFRTMASR
jgi:alkylated DNA repair dioxygenase AlkB